MKPRRRRFDPSRSRWALVVSCTNAPARVEPTVVPTSVSTATALPAPAATVTPSLSATATPRPRPAATAAPSAVGFTVQQLMLPLVEWLRFFHGSDALASDAAHYSRVELVLLVKSDTDTTASFMAGVKCDPSVDRAGSSSDAGPTSAKELVAPSVGESALACSYSFADGLPHVEVAATHRNVFVLVQAARWNLQVPESTAVDESVAILQRQFAIIDRLSPPMR